jgi:hypothetical protein
MTELDFPGSSKRVTPGVMTTTADGRLFLLQPFGGGDDLLQPVLFWTKASAASGMPTFNSQTVAYSNSAGKTVSGWIQPVDTQAPSVSARNAWLASIARGPGNSVRVVYNAKSELHGNQIALVIKCTLSADGESLAVSNLLEVTSAYAADSAVLFPYFIQADQPGLTERTLLHYMEVPLTGASLQCSSKVWEFGPDGQPQSSYAVSLQGGQEDRVPGVLENEMA